MGEIKFEEDMCEECFQIKPCIKCDSSEKPSGVCICEGCYRKKMKKWLKR